MTNTSIGHQPLPAQADEPTTESDGKTLNDRGTNETESEPDPSLESPHAEPGPAGTSGKYNRKSPYIAGNT